MTDKDLQAGSAGIQISHVHSVSVSFSCTPESRSVIIQTDASQNQFLLSVAVHIRRHSVVVAVSVTFGGRVVAGVKAPASHQFLVLHIKGRSRHSGVVASDRHRTGMDTVQIAYCSQKTIYPVSVFIPPLVHISSGIGVIHGIQGFSRLSVEKGVVFRSAQHIAAAVSVVRRCIADHLSGSIHRSVRCLTGHLRLAVQIEIRHQELRVMLSRADVSSKVNPPQPLSREPVAVDKHIVRISGL